jgi:DNA polymerase
VTPDQRAALRFFHDLGFEEVRRPATAAPKVESRIARERQDRAEAARPEGAPTSARSAAQPATATEDAAAAKDPVARSEALGLVRQEALACVACRLCEGRTNVVFGSGNPDAELMFVGEGPGANEDLQGLPFVGAAGELLTRIIQAIDLRREDVYIANVVKCRPPNNRDPQPDEVAACIGFLRRQVHLVRPRLLVALGRIAAQTMLSCTTPVGRLRGTWHRFEGVPLRVTYHPAALLRSSDLKRPTWDDMQVVRERLRDPAPDRGD